MFSVLKLVAYLGTVSHISDDRRVPFLMYPILSSKQTTHTHIHTYINAIKLHKLCTYHTHIPYTPRYKSVIKFISRNMISEDELLDCDTSDDITLLRK